MTAKQALQRHKTEARTLPDFLVIGAAKAGTSAIFQYMSQHPEIFMPAKEIRFFAFDDGPEAQDRMDRFGKDHFAVQTLADYEALFTDADPAKVWGENSPIYLESPSAPQRIKDLVPDAKLIASLRNPVHRAFSGYIMQVRSGREHREMHDSFDVDSHHVQASFYSPQVKRYLDIFPREQLMLFRYEDFSSNNKQLMGDIFRFIGVNPDFEPALSERHNVSTYPKSRVFNALVENKLTRNVLRPAIPGWARSLARSAKKKNLGPAPKLPPDIHVKLIEIFRDDVHRLEDLTDLDLSSWLKPPS